MDAVRKATGARRATVKSREANGKALARRPNANGEASLKAAPSVDDQTPVHEARGLLPLKLGTQRRDFVWERVRGNLAAGKFTRHRVAI